MPELPEVEVIRRGLLPNLLGATLVDVRTGPKDLRLPIPRKELGRWIQSATITDLFRRGKYLLFVTDSDAVVVVHLGMTGKLGIFPPNTPDALHDHVCFRLADDRELRYNDVRRFGCLQVLPPGKPSSSTPFASLGPEPLPTANPLWLEPVQPVFSGQYLKDRAGNRARPVKNFLMDNGTVVGIGNIYANEILFQTGISPSTPVGSITLERWLKVAKITKEVLQNAIKMGGSTIRDYVDSSGGQGYFQIQLSVYGKEGKPCQICRTPIRKEIIAGRATYLCPCCQT